MAKKYTTHTPINRPKKRRLQPIDKHNKASWQKRDAARKDKQDRHLITRLAEPGEDIPPSAMLAARLGEVTDDDIAWARDTVDAQRGVKHQ